MLSSTHFRLFHHSFHSQHLFSLNPSINNISPFSLDWSYSNLFFFPNNFHVLNILFHIHGVFFKSFLSWFSVLFDILSTYIVFNDHYRVKLLNLFSLTYSFKYFFILVQMLFRSIHPSMTHRCRSIFSIINVYLIQ